MQVMLAVEIFYYGCFFKKTRVQKQWYCSAINLENADIIQKFVYLDDSLIELCVSL